MKRLGATCRKQLVTALAAAILATAGPMTAGADPALIAWNGGASTTDWGTAENWNFLRVPGATDKVVLDHSYLPALPPAIYLNSVTASIQGLDFNCPDTVTIANSPDSAAGPSTLTLVATGDKGNFVNMDASASGTLSFANGAQPMTLQLSGSGGTFNVSNPLGLLNIASPITDSGTTNVYKNGEGTAIFAGNVSYHGFTVVNGGILAITGTTSNQGSYTVCSGATLAGTGTIGLANSQTLVVATGGTLAPGDTGPTPAIGTLKIGNQTATTTLSRDSTINFDLDTPTHKDLLDVAGYLILPGAAGNVVTVNLNYVGTASLSSGSYTFLKYNMLLGGSTANFALGSTPLPYKAYSFASSGKNLQVVISNNDTNLLVRGTPDGTTTTIDFGRMLQGSTAQRTISLDKTGSAPTTYSVTAAGVAFCNLAATGNFAAGTQTLTATVGMSTVATGSFTSGNTITLRNTAPDGVGTSGALEVPDVISVIGTVINKRTIGSVAVDMGKWLTATPVSMPATCSSFGSSNQMTSALVAAPTGLPDANGIALTGSAFSFNGTLALQSDPLTWGGVFATSGSKSGTVTLTVSSLEVGLNEGPYAPVTVSYSANAFQAAVVTAAPVTGGVLLVNAAPDGGPGSQRAAARIISQTTTNGFQLGPFLAAGVNIGTVLNPAQSATATVSYMGGGTLNGTYRGKAILGFEHADQTIHGTAPGDLGLRQVDLAAVVTGHTGSGTASFSTGDSFAGFSMTSSNPQRPTLATFQAGLTTSARLLGLAFSDAGANRPADNVTVTGTGPEQYVLEMTYDPTPILQGLAVGIASEDLLRLGWLNNSTWLLAIAGNSGGTPTYHLGISYTQYAAANTPKLGDYGLDKVSHTAWAVLDHPGLFTVGAFTQVPEPASLSLLAFGAATLLHRRRSHR